MSRLKKLVIILAILVVAFPAGTYGYFYYKLSTIHDSSVDDKSLKNLTHKNKKGITNILLMGTDARPNETRSRSDSIMILTIDSKHGDIKLTSLARDTFVQIPGHGWTKLTHANAYGGPALLIRTIENNFDIDLNSYALVNFDSFMTIVDTIGGVDVNIKKEYIKEFNKFLPEDYSWDKNPNKGKIQYIYTPGVHHLNGYQTLTFTRIRHNDTALERDSRQRQVMQVILSKVKTLPLTKYPDLLNSILPYVKTNMEPNDILGLGSEIVQIGNFNIKQFEFPLDDGIHSKNYLHGKYGWVFAFQKDTLKFLHDFIFNDVIYNPSLHKHDPKMINWPDED